MTKPVGAIADKLTAQNRQVAAIILADPAHHGGEAALIVKWARRVMNRPDSPQPLPIRRAPA